MGNQLRTPARNDDSTFVDETIRNYRDKVEGEVLLRHGDLKSDQLDREDWEDLLGHIEFLVGGRQVDIKDQVRRKERTLRRQIRLNHMGRCRRYIEENGSIVDSNSRKLSPAVIVARMVGLPPRISLGTWSLSDEDEEQEDKSDNCNSGGKKSTATLKKCQQRRHKSYEVLTQENNHHGIGSVEEVEEEEENEEQQYYPIMKEFSALQLSHVVNVARSVSPSNDSKFKKKDKKGPCCLPMMRYYTSISDSQNNNGPAERGNKEREDGNEENECSSSEEGSQSALQIQFDKETCYLPEMICNRSRQQTENAGAEGNSCDNASLSSSKMGSSLLFMYSEDDEDDDEEMRMLLQSHYDTSKYDHMRTLNNSGQHQDQLTSHAHVQVTTTTTRISRGSWSSSTTGSVGAAADAGKVPGYSYGGQQGNRHPHQQQHQYYVDEVHDIYYNHYVLNDDNMDNSSTLKALQEVDECMLASENEHAAAMIGGAGAFRSSSSSSSTNNIVIITNSEGRPIFERFEV